MTTVRETLAKTINASHQAIAMIFSAHLSFIWHLRKAFVLITLLRNRKVNMI